MTPKTPVAGIDIGSGSIELVVLENGQIVESRRVPTTFDPLAQCRMILASLPIMPIIATGYGCKLVIEELPD